jgi:hypothetical protein
MVTLEPPPLAHLLRRVVPGPGGCWIWTGAIDGRGYGNVGRMASGARKNWIVHRLVYEFAVGPIPPDHDVHHICEVKRCIFPKHLEPVTRREHQGVEGWHPKHTRPAIDTRLANAAARRPPWEEWP